VGASLYDRNRGARRLLRRCGWTSSSWLKLSLGASVPADDGIATLLRVPVGVSRRPETDVTMTVGVNTETPVWLSSAPGLGPSSPAAWVTVTLKVDTGQRRPKDTANPTNKTPATLNATTIAVSFRPTAASVMPTTRAQLPPKKVTVGKTSHAHSW
jgi:hypothetical protein